MEYCCPECLVTLLPIATIFYDEQSRLRCPECHKVYSLRRVSGRTTLEETVCGIAGQQSEAQTVDAYIEVDNNHQDKREAILRYKIGRKLWCDVYIAVAGCDNSTPDICKDLADNALEEFNKRFI